MNKIKTVFSLKNILPQSLFGRSLLILIIPVLLIQIFTSYMFFERHWSKMTRHLAFGVAGEITHVVRMIENNQDPEFLNELKINAERDFNFEISFEPDALLGPEHSISSFFVWESIVAQTLTFELKHILRKPFVLDIDFEEKWVRVSIQTDKGVINILLPGRRLFSSSGYIFLLWVIGSSLLLLLIAILFMRNQIRPIRKLAVAAERLGKGRDVPAFRPSGAREIRQAAESFINMHKRIKRQVEQRTAMLAGVSHDLRTPLTRLKLQLEMMEDTEDTLEMKKDITEMQKMLDGYLEFVRGEGDEDIEYTDFNLLLEKVITAANRQGIEITKDTEDKLSISLRPSAFGRCLSNLITNAGKYADRVWVSAYIEDEKLFIHIEDNGPGIPKDQYEDVFKPFFRVDSSRNTETGGVGLGLPIAMDIVHAHGGKIWLDKSEKGGLKVSIRLPL